MNSIETASFLHNTQKETNFIEILLNFQKNYVHAISETDFSKEEALSLFEKYRMLILQQMSTPHLFEPFHKRVTEPFDYTEFALNLVRPLIKFSESKVSGWEWIEEMVSQIQRGENVVLFANHQTEPDPQILQIFLEEKYRDFGREMIFVAGDRVTTDPLAVPLSLGCNLLCIYSKKRIEYPPQHKQWKMQHNQRTMKQMGQLLREGGKCIYVAPSGGRDRKSEKGVVEVSAFDPQSVEMFFLIAEQAKKPTHFYPLALDTYHLLPPPHSVDRTLGEERLAAYSPIHIAFGEEILRETIPGKEVSDKKERRRIQAEYIYHLVRELYERKPLS